MTGSWRGWPADPRNQSPPALSAATQPKGTVARRQRSIMRRPNSTILGSPCDCLDTCTPPRPHDQEATAGMITPDPSHPAQ
ncbi:hypothetical protein FBY35_1271 [Streptomyces sp. SLBN-118]|nr:hypothetical protein FBY35_1271 [Streptomyces sp. SLBN-118]